MRHFNDIIHEIGNKSEIIRTAVKTDIDEEQYDDIIDSVYNIDYTPKWQIELKKCALEKYPCSLGIIIFDVAKPEFRVNDRTGEMLSDTCARLKKQIRKAYGGEVHQDAILHIGDNYRVNREIIDALSQKGILAGEMQDY